MVAAKSAPIPENRYGGLYLHPFSAAQRKALLISGDNGRSVWFQQRYICHSVIDGGDLKIVHYGLRTVMTV